MDGFCYTLSFFGCRKCNECALTHVLFRNVRRAFVFYSPGSLKKSLLVDTRTPHKRAPPLNCQIDPQFPTPNLRVGMAHSRNLCAIPT